MTQSISVDYLLRLNSCWSRAQLEQAAESWPDPITWSWFLGQRLASLSRAAAWERLATAVAHMAAAKLRAPMSGGKILQYGKKCSDEQFANLTQAFGAWLDEPEDAHKLAALASALNDPLPQLIEAKP